MEGESALLRAYSVATLTQTRAQLRNWWGRLMIGTIGAIFGLISLLVGQMLTFEPIQGDYFAVVLWSNGGQYWWNFPGLLVVQPWGILALPFLPTVAMVLVCYGVGLGMSVAVLIGVRMYRQRRRGTGATTALGTATGLTPAMIALVTLGACCSTTAAATAGLGVAAQTSGATVQTLLLNNWYLNIFQLVILWVALVAQEQLLVAYGIFFDPEPSRGPPARSRDALALPKGLARLALLVGGITWSLSTLADWTRIAPGSAGAGQWVHWILQQQAPGLFAVAAALAPSGAAHSIARHLARPEGWVLRLVLLAAGISLLAWTPPAVAAAGVFGWMNELLGVLGFSAAVGAVPVAPIAGWGLAFHWAFQLLLLGGFATAAAMLPSRLPAALAPTSAPSSPSAVHLASSTDQVSVAGGPASRSEL